MPLVERLSKLNRKERFWVVHEAIGPHPLSNEFRERLEGILQVVDPSVEVPADAWWAIDFHFDWLLAALGLPEGANKKTIQDIDLVVAFGSTVVLIEAKYDSGWTNKQLGEKMPRLAELQVLGQGQSGPGGTQIFFVLMSPRWRMPQKLEVPAEWRLPNGSILWLEMNVPDPGMV